ncbi:MAG: hypothetical protein ACRDPC_07580 [Solirubrobacteraceae bacterium]
MNVPGEASSNQVAGGQDRLLKWVGEGSVGATLVLLALAVLWSWPTKVAAGIVQLLGLWFAALGVAVVRAWLEAAADATIEVKRGLDRWWALRREQVRTWWIRKRGKTIPAVIRAAPATASGSAGGTVTVGHPAVDRETISDRDWLGFVNDQVDVLRDRLNRAEKDRSLERREWDQRLAAQREQLRVEMLKATRQGWELIVAGLGCSALGALVGMTA